MSCGNVLLDTALCSTDIVIPGIYVALMLRYDVFARIKRHPYFSFTMLSYVAGMGCTIGVMLAFNAAQPALLYLVPAILLASFGVAAARGEVGKLLAWSEVCTTWCWSQLPPRHVSFRRSKLHRRRVPKPRRNNHHHHVMSTITMYVKIHSTKHTDSFMPWRHFSWHPLPQRCSRPPTASPEQPIPARCCPTACQSCPWCQSQSPRPGPSC